MYFRVSMRFRVKVSNIRIFNIIRNPMMFPENKGRSAKECQIVRSLLKLVAQSVH